MARLAAVLALSGAASAVIRVHPPTTSFLADDGRILVMHGGNAVVKVPPFVPDSGPAPWSWNMSMTRADIRFLHDTLGMNALRLGAMWAGLEVAPGVYNKTYLAGLRAILDDAAAEGVAVLLDMHQDVMSPYFCGEGFPDFYVAFNTSLPAFPSPDFWINFTVDPRTLVPTPEQCATDFNFAEYLYTFVSNNAWGNFWHNSSTINAWTAAWSVLATEFAGHPALLGYELMNEPWPCDAFDSPWLECALNASEADRTLMFPAYQKAYAAIRAADPDHIVMYDTSVSESRLGVHTGLPSGPGGHADDEKQAYSWHVYCENPVNGTGDPINATACADGELAKFDFEQQNVAHLGGGSMLTEFGAWGSADEDFLIGSGLLDAADSREKVPQSWLYWQLKAFGDPTTNNSSAQGMYLPDGSLELVKARTLSRTYAPLIAGIPASVSMEFNAISGAFFLAYDINAALPAASQVTSIFASADYHYPRGWTATITPPGAATLTATPASSWLLLTHAQGATGRVSLHLVPKE